MVVFLLLEDVNRMGDYNMSDHRVVAVAEVIAVAAAVVDKAVINEVLVVVALPGVVPLYARPLCDDLALNCDMV